MDHSRTLVEHFFRHEYGRLVALLTRSLGVRNLELAEDVVQTAIFKALQTWRRDGIPANPGAWLYRTSRNLAIDAIRRNQTENRWLTSHSNSIQNGSLDPGEWIPVDDELCDEPLRLLFLCCHPDIPLESCIAFALKTIGGFSVEEVASALLISKSNAEKRITRAKEKLREAGTELTELDCIALQDRIDAVRSTIYLLFNEGYCSANGKSTLRKELCQEAIRLVRMLVQSVPISVASSYALLALMLMHTARFDSRIDEFGSLVLLEDQNRSYWDWSLIREAMDCIGRSMVGNQLTRYHVEAAIAWEHCRAKSFSEIDWAKIVESYSLLLQLHSNPMVLLNHAIAVSYACGVEHGLRLIIQISDQDRTRLRPWWDCAIADVFYRLKEFQFAIDHWHDALRFTRNQAQRELITKRILSAKKHPRTEPRVLT